MLCMNCYILSYRLTCHLISGSLLLQWTINIFRSVNCSWLRSVSPSVAIDTP